MDRIGGSLSLCLIQYLLFPTKAHLRFARIGSDLGFAGVVGSDRTNEGGFAGVEFCWSLLKVRTKVEFWNLNKIKSIGLDFFMIELNLAHQNRVYCTRDASFLNSFENVLTNKIVWKLMLFGKKKKKNFRKVLKFMIVSCCDGNASQRYNEKDMPLSTPGLTLWNVDWEWGEWVSCAV